MKTLINIRSLMACAALAATVPAILDAQVRPTFYGQPVLDRSQLPDATGLDPTLAQIVALAQAGDDWQAAAERAGLIVQDEGVLIELAAASDIDFIFSPDMPYFSSGDPARPRAFFNPASSGDIKGMRAVRQPVANSYGDIANEAEGALLPDLLDISDAAADGVEIVVIDLGFGGIDNSAEVGKVQRFQANLDSDADRHGTAMIELIRDIAPGVGITAIRLDPYMDIIGATNLAAALGAQVIVCPLSWFGLPGEGQACEAAAIAAANGITFVNAAGNFADRRYFEGQDLATVNIGADTFVDFGTDPYQFINGMNGGDRFSVHFASQGAMQVELFSWDGLSANFVLVAQGEAGAPDQVVGQEYVNGMYYFPMVRQLAPGSVAPFRMFAVGCDLHFSGAEGSITNPAAMDEVVSVGAIDVARYEADGRPEVYSSQGGGIFGTSVDINGPTGCTTGTYGPQGFSGTSCASANIAALIALQLAQTVGTAPGRVETMSPGNGAVVTSESVDLAWVAVTGTDIIVYRLEVATDEAFDNLILDLTTELTCVNLKHQGDQLLYWRVTAGNDYGQAKASDVLTLQFDVLPIVEFGTGDGVTEEKAGDDLGADANIGVDLLSADRPLTGQQDSATGCAASKGTTGMAAILAALAIAAAIVRTRRKTA